ncbi:hypothetical protein HaLaN_04309, partial [Haematococcus lacustris]
MQSHNTTPLPNQDSSPPSVILPYMPSTCVQSFIAQQPPHSGALGGVGWEGWASRGCAWGGGEGKGWERVKHSGGHSGGGGVPCTPGRHRVGCWPDIPFVHNQLTTLGRWGLSDVAHRAKETRLAAVICSRAHVAVREQRLQWLALMVTLRKPNRQCQCDKRYRKRCTIERVLACILPTPCWGRLNPSTNPEGDEIALHPLHLSHPVTLCHTGTFVLCVLCVATCTSCTWHCCWVRLGTVSAFPHCQRLRHLHRNAQLVHQQSAISSEHRDPVVGDAQGLSHIL